MMIACLRLTPSPPRPLSSCAGRGDPRVPRADRVERRCRLASRWYRFARACVGLQAGRQSVQSSVPADVRPVRAGLPMITFQEAILRLQTYWNQQGCALLQPIDLEVGAGTSHTATFLRAIGPEPWRAGYVQPSRRPKDARYGENPNRLHQHHQYQVVLKPSPPDILELYLGSLLALGIDTRKNDIRFVEDNWENPTLGGVGSRLGSVDERHGDHAVHLLPAGRRSRVQADHGRDHVWTRTPDDVPAGRRQRVRPRLHALARSRRGEGAALRRRVPPERGRAEPIQLRGERSGRSCSASSGSSSRRRNG